MKLLSLKIANVINLCPRATIQYFLTDHSCGLCSLLPNLMRNYGWNPGKHDLKFFGSLLDKKLKMGPAVTFKQVKKEKSRIEKCMAHNVVKLL